MKIAFHDNQLCERGTTISLYDYAYFNKYYLGNESVIMYYGSDHRNVPKVINKFSKEFKLLPYENWNNDSNRLLKENGVDLLYMIKAGGRDGKIADKNICKTVVHCVFWCTKGDQHGDIYASIAPWVSGNNGIFPFVRHIINLPNSDNNLRNKLNIPKDSRVFGRHGGYMQFDIKYVQDSVYQVAKENSNIFFIFVNTEKFCENLNNIIHLPMIVDLNDKVEFINTCDAMIWGRSDGEIYSLSQGEFSSRNKPIICTKNVINLGHVHKLGDNAIWYNSDDELKKILINFDREKNKLIDWNMYKDSKPELVMDEFKKVFIDPLF